jgi:hypothetical protein
LGHLSSARPPRIAMPCCCDQRRHQHHATQQNGLGPPGYARVHRLRPREQNIIVEVAKRPR